MSFQKYLLFLKCNPRCLSQCLLKTLKRKYSPACRSINFFPVRNIHLDHADDWGIAVEGARSSVVHLYAIHESGKEWLVDYWCVTLLEYYLYENGPCENTVRKIVSHRFRSNRVRFWMNNVKLFPWKWLALQVWLRNCRAEMEGIIVKKAQLKCLFDSIEEINLF